MLFVKCKVCGVEYRNCKYMVIYHSKGLPTSGTKEEHKAIHKHPKGVESCE